MRLRTPSCGSGCGTGVVERGTADLLKNLRALARGKHDDFSVAFEAADEIERLLSLVERMRQIIKHGSMCMTEQSIAQRKVWNE
jgi:hypothetical protein